MKCRVCEFDSETTKEKGWHDELLDFEEVKIEPTNTSDPTLYYCPKCGIVKVEVLR